MSYERFSALLELPFRVGSFEAMGSNFRLLGYFDAAFEVRPRRGCIEPASLFKPIFRSSGGKLGWLDDFLREAVSLRNGGAERTKPRLALLFRRRGGEWLRQIFRLVEEGDLRQLCGLTCSGDEESFFYPCRNTDEGYTRLWILGLRFPTAVVCLDIFLVLGVLGRKVLVVVLKEPVMQPVKRLGFSALLAASLLVPALLWGQSSFFRTRTTPPAPPTPPPTKVSTAGAAGLPATSGPLSARDRFANRRSSPYDPR